MFDFEPIKTTIWDWLNQAINNGAAENADGTTRIIRAEEDGVRPTPGELFVEYKFLTGLVKIGMADEKIPKPNPATGFTLRGQRQFTVSIKAFGDNSAGCLATVQQSLSSPVECSILRAGGLAVRDDEVITDATVFQETDFEERAVLDVVFGVTLEKDIDPGTIESVEVTANIPGGKKSTIDKNSGILIEEP